MANDVPDTETSHVANISVAWEMTKLVVANTEMKWDDQQAAAKIIGDIYQTAYSKVATATAR